MLLDGAGLAHRAVAPRLDDSAVPPAIGRSIAERTVSLAWLKAASTRDAFEAAGSQAGWILAADTLVADGRVAMGKPESPEEAERMLRLLAGRSHRVWTGHVLLALGSRRRRIGASSAEVRFPAIDDLQLRDHLDDGRWQGRAGGYSFDELVEAGWRVECVGDPEVVLGLSTRWVSGAIDSLSGDRKGAG